MTPFLPRLDRCTLTAARVVPSVSAIASDPSNGLRRSRVTISRSRSVNAMLVILSLPYWNKEVGEPARGPRTRRSVLEVKRLVVVSVVLALAGAVAPWNGPAGADVPAPEVGPS